MKSVVASLAVKVSDKVPSSEVSPSFTSAAVITIVGAMSSIVIVGPPVPTDNWSVKATLNPLQYSGSVVIHEIDEWVPKKRIIPAAPPVPLKAEVVPVNI